MIGKNIFLAFLSVLVTNSLFGVELATSNIPLKMTYTSAWIRGDIDWSVRIREDEHTNAVNDLVKAGIICKVLGHQWQSGCSAGLGCAVYHSGPVRNCVICKTEQTQSIGDWK